MGSIQAIPFDVDGTLADTEDAHGACLQLGIATTTAPENMAALLGRGRRTEDCIALEDSDICLNAGLAQEIIRRMQAKYAAHLPQREAAVQAVRTAAAHCRVALASGSPRPTSTCACWNALACSPHKQWAWKTRAMAFARCTPQAWASSRRPAPAMRWRPMCVPWPACTSKA